MKLILHQENGPWEEFNVVNLEFFPNEFHVHVNKAKRYSITISQGEYNLPTVYEDLGEAQNVVDKLNRLLKTDKFSVIEVS